MYRDTSIRRTANSWVQYREGNSSGESHSKSRTSTPESFRLRFVAAFSGACVDQRLCGKCPKCSHPMPDSEQGEDAAAHMYRVYKMLGRRISPRIDQKTI